MNYTVICKGDGYTLAAPENFYVRHNVDGRDFIAWLPGENPDDWESSSFVIYAGRKQTHEVFNNAVIPQLYEAFAYAITCNSAVKHSFEKLSYILSENEKVPGGISAGFDGKTIYYNAYMGLPGCLQPLRIDVKWDDLATLEEADSSVLELLNHMEPEDGVKLPVSPDDERFCVEEVSSQTAKDWNECLTGYIRQITLVRNLRQNSMVGMYKDQQSAGIASLPDFKSEIADMLSNIVKLAEGVIRPAEKTYFGLAERGIAPEVLNVYASALRDLLNFADQTVVISGDELCIVSDYAAEVKKKLEESGSNHSDDFILAVTTEETPEEAAEDNEPKEIDPAKREAALAEFERTKKAELVASYKGRYEEASAVLSAAMGSVKAQIEDARGEMAILQRSEKDRKKALEKQVREKQEKLDALQAKAVLLKEKYIAAVKTLPAYMEELKAEFLENYEG